jgi:hypothetical protein
MYLNIKTYKRNLHSKNDLVLKVSTSGDFVRFFISKAIKKAMTEGYNP